MNKRRSLYEFNAIDLEIVHFTVLQLDGML